MRALALWLGALGLALGGAPGCERSEGALQVTSTGRACLLDLDCGAGRFCANGGCSLECTLDLDCGPARVCSPCGRCGASGALDTACLPPTERPCADDASCVAQLGDGYACNPSGVCAARCSDAKPCSERGFVCAPEQGLCEERCYSDGACYFRGFARSCKLPPGVDQETNLLAEDAVAGQCVARPGGLGLPAPGASPPPSADYQGLWAFLLVSAVRTEGIPVISRTDTASIQHTLVKAELSGDDVVFTVKWCGVRFQPFHEKDLKIVPLVEILLPTPGVDSLDVVSFRARSVPQLRAGATFTTEELLDLRGAKLNEPFTDPLPTMADLTHQRDQDRDGHPGLTVLSSGILTGELYQSQRTRAPLEVQVVDEQHLHGLMKTTVVETLLGASSPDLVNSGVSSAHPQVDRSYFRAVRLENDATCTTVLDLAAVEGGWLAYEPHFDPDRRP